MQLPLGPHTTASAPAGFALLHDRNLESDQDRPVRAARRSTHALERATVGADFERQFVPSFGFGGANSSQELRGYVHDAAAAAGLYMQGSAAWRRIDAVRGQRSASSTRSGCAPRSATPLARWVRVEALYTFTRQDSIVTGGEVDRHRVGVQFVISQPMRIQ